MHRGMRPIIHHCHMVLLQLRAVKDNMNAITGIPGQQSCCSLCRERLRDKHSHFGQWKSELQQLLLSTLKYVGSCVCKACEQNEGLMVGGEYIPRWGLKSKSGVYVDIHFCKSTCICLDTRISGS